MTNILKGKKKEAIRQFHRLAMLELYNFFFKLFMKIYKSIKKYFNKTQQLASICVIFIFYLININKNFIIII